MTYAASVQKATNDWNAANAAYKNAAAAVQLYESMDYSQDKQPYYDAYNK